LDHTSRLLKNSKGFQNRHCERSEAIQKFNKNNERLDRHVGLRPPRDDGRRLFRQPAEGHDPGSWTIATLPFRKEVMISRQA
jgi:hypothetical protein